MYQSLAVLEENEYLTFHVHLFLTAEMFIWVSGIAESQGGGTLIFS